MREVMTIILIQPSNRDGLVLGGAHRCPLSVSKAFPMPRRCVPEAFVWCSVFEFFSFSCLVPLRLRLRLLLCVFMRVCVPLAGIDLSWICPASSRFVSFSCTRGEEGGALPLLVPFVLDASQLHFIQPSHRNGVVASA